MTNAVAIWIWLCAYLNCAGWFLSAIHQLNAASYIVALVVWMATLFIIKRFWLPADGSPFCLRKISRRFRRPFPLVFLILSVMAFLGGALYAPTNYDALAYRLPRVLHWLAAGQWQWIHTHFPRLNNRACGMEWLSAPLISLLKTDRLLFLINIISFLLLPGLTFSVLTRLGVRRKVAWHWMWIAPSGYCFLLQAGSISNDAFAAPYALAAIDFALRAKISKHPRDLFCSILAVALLTSAKTGNMTLLLPWAIAILPSLKSLLLRPIATAAVCIIAVFASFLPSAACNQHYCHDWSGLSLEDIQSHGNIVFRSAANTALFAILNLSPPVFPEAGRWDHFVQKTLPPDWNAELRETLIEPAAGGLEAPQMQIEENAGLGLGICLLLLLSIAFAVVRSGKSFFPIPLHSVEGWWLAALVIAPWVSLAALLSQSTVYPIGRIASPYYILLLPLLLASPAHEQLVKKFWWRGAAYVVFAMAAMLLFISPARPLFPATTIFEKIHERHPDSKLLARAEDVYSVYQDRNHSFDPALNALPPNLKTLGFVTYDDPETSLWRPFGSRNIVHVCPGDSAAYLKTEGVEYILAKGNLFGKQFPELDVWLKTVNGAVVQKIELNLRVTGNPKDWYLVKLN
jgi:hypothetical protein